MSKLTKSLKALLILITIGLLFSGVLYANQAPAELSPTDTAPITQSDIDKYCKYCELTNSRFKKPTDITRDKLVKLWKEVGWSDNRATFAISRISTMYDAQIENDETANSLLEFMGPTEEELDLIVANQESLAHAISLLEKYQLKF